MLFSVRFSHFITSIERCIETARMKLALQEEKQVGNSAVMSKEMESSHALQ